MNCRYLAIMIICDPTNQIGKSGIDWIWDSNVFVEHKKVWQKYLNSDKDILCLFSQTDETLDKEYTLNMNTNTLVVKAQHSYLGIEPILNAIKVINEIFSFDFLINTTSSSFWVLPNLKRQLHNTSKTGIYKGRIGYNKNPFISGSGIVMSRDVCQKLLESEDFMLNEFKLNNQYANDVLIADVLHDKYNIYAIPIDWSRDFCGNNVENLNFKIKNIDNVNICHYRVKNFQNRLYFDTIIMNKLYDYHYGLKNSLGFLVKTCKNNIMSYT